jgi:hypothetical protein
MEYRAAVGSSETILGVGLALQLPTGHYEEDKLLNLGANRFTIRPQLGVVHEIGSWSLEVTGSAWFFTDNDDFFGGRTLAQDPLFTLQGHVVYTIRPGLWISTGLGYGFGAESTIDAVAKDDQKGNVAWGLNLGIPINRQLGFKIGYLGLRTQESTGSDLDSLVAGFSVLW